MKSGPLPSLIFATSLTVACGGAVPSASRPSSTHESRETDAATHSHLHPKSAPSIFRFADNYEAARADAEAHRRPMFLLMTATWCEPCAILVRHILTDPNLGPLLTQFTLLSSEIDNIAATDAYRLFPVNVWPTIFIVNPFDETEAAALQGFAQVNEMKLFLEEGLRTFGDFLANPGGDFTTVFPNIRKGRHLAAEGKYGPAADAFLDALALMPAASNRRIDTSIRLMESATKAGRFDKCVQAAMSLPPNSQHNAEMLIHGASCAGNAGASVKRRYTDWVRPLLNSIVAENDGGITAAEKSSAFSFLAADAEQRGDETSAQTYRNQHFELLMTIPLFDTDPRGISSLELDRIQLYLKMNRAPAINSLLQNAAKKKPRDWRPLYLIASTEFSTGQYAAAAEAADQAYQLAEDPSRLEILWLLADIFSAAADREKELDVLRTMAEYIEVLPAAIFSSEQIQNTSDRLKKLEALLGDK